MFNNIWFVINYNLSIELNRFVFKLLGFLSAVIEWFSYKDQTTHADFKTNNYEKINTDPTWLLNITKRVEDQRMRRRIFYQEEPSLNYLSKRYRWIFLLQSSSCSLVFWSQPFTVSTPVWIKVKSWKETVSLLSKRIPISKIIQGS